MLVFTGSSNKFVVLVVPAVSMGPFPVSWSLKRLLKAIVSIDQHVSGQCCKICNLLASADCDVRDDPVVGHVSTCHGNVVEDSGQIHTVGSRRAASVEGHRQRLRNVLASSMVSVVVSTVEVCSHNHGQRTSST